MIKITSGQLVATDAALASLADNRLPFLLMRKVNLIRRELEDYLEPWRKDIAPFVEKHGVDGAIGPSSPGWAAFCAAIEPFCTQELELRVEPLKEADLEPLGAREDFAWRGQDYDFLRRLGVIVDG